MEDECFSTRYFLGKITGVSGRRVVRVSEEIMQKYGFSAVIRVDNGLQFRSKALDSWAHQNKVRLDFIEQGRATQNDYIKSFDGRFRVECLNHE